LGDLGDHEVEAFGFDLGQVDPCLVAGDVDAV